MTEPSVPLVQTILSCRCPRCGRGKLFNGVLSVHNRCPVCNLDLGQSDTGDAGAVLVIIVLGAIVGGLAIWTEFRFEPPWWVHAILWPTITVPAAIWLMRLAKSALIAMQYRHRSTEMGL
jgi:uncharacterized protein (DUF983 family)